MYEVRNSVREELLFYQNYIRVYKITFFILIWLNAFVVIDLKTKLKFQELILLDTISLEEL